MIKQNWGSKAINCFSFLKQLVELVLSRPFPQRQRGKRRGMQCDVEITIYKLNTFRENIFFALLIRSKIFLFVINYEIPQWANFFGWNNKREDGKNVNEISSFLERKRPEVKLFSTNFPSLFIYPLIHGAISSFTFYRTIFFYILLLPLETILAQNRL